MSHGKISGLTKGVHHVGLTVPDLRETRAFFIDTLGFGPVGELPEYPAVFVTDGTTMITLWQAANPAGAVRFDRKNVIGLHHLALTVNGNWSLGELRQRLIADNFYIASSYWRTSDAPAHGADVSHRGGKPGFVRLDGDRALAFPDLPGNAYFNTLGNLLLHPRAGLATTLSTESNTPSELTLARTCSGNPAASRLSRV